MSHTYMLQSHTPRSNVHLMETTNPTPHTVIGEALAAPLPITPDQLLAIVLEFRSQLTPDELGAPFRDLHDEFDPNQMLDDCIGEQVGFDLDWSELLTVANLAAEIHDALAVLS